MPTQEQLDKWYSMTPEQQAYVQAVNGVAPAPAPAPTPTAPSLSFGSDSGGTTYGGGTEFNYLTGQYEYGIPKQQQTVNLGGGGTTISDATTGEELATGYYNDGVFEPIETAPVSDGPTAEQLERWDNLTQEQRDTFTYSTPTQKEKLAAWIEAGSPGGAEGLAQLPNEGPTQEQFDEFYGSTPEQQEKFVDWVNAGQPGGPEWLDWIEGLPTEWYPGYGPDVGADPQGGNAPVPGDPTYGGPTPTPTPTPTPPPTGGGGGGGSPGPGGIGSGGSGVDTSWDWSGGGGYGQGYDPNQYLFQSVRPGVDSPWASPGRTNADFYARQLDNLMNQTDNLQLQQRQAAEIRNQAMQNPLQNDWDWGQANIPGSGKMGLSWTQRNALEHMTNAGLSPDEIRDLHSWGVETGRLDPLLNSSPGQPAGSNWEPEWRPEWQPTWAPPGQQFDSWNYDNGDWVPQWAPIPTGGQ